MSDLTATTDLLKLFGDPTRARLLHLVAAEELTVAEITRVTGLAQSRVSTHLGKLHGAGLVRLRRSGSATFASLNRKGMPGSARTLWALVADTADDALVAADRLAVQRVVSERGPDGKGSWADGVAGRMERHYSPGRTWEAAARALVGLGRYGDVLDIASGDGALAELVAPLARSVTCLDISPRLVAAGRERFGAAGGKRGAGPRVRFEQGDMHALPFDDAAFDHVLLVNSLTYAERPDVVLSEAARVLRPEGTLVAVALRRHEHVDTAARYDHRQLGFEPDGLSGLARRAGLEVEACAVTSRERRAPHFEVITLHARRSDPGPAAGKARAAARKDARKDASAASPTPSPKRSRTTTPKTRPGR